MTAPRSSSSDVEVLEVRRVRLVEVAAPELSEDERLVMDRAWSAAVRANPSLFDGPVAASAGLVRDEPDGVLLSWMRTTYRHFALRRVPGVTAWLPALFVTVVQPSDDGRMLVGRQSSWTAAPGRWQLPGGSIEPPAPHAPLDIAALRRNAVRELAEETGNDAAPDDLALWLVTRGARASVGVVFRAPSQPADWLLERHAALGASERAKGREPELERVRLVRAPEELSDLGGPCVDHLEPVVRRYAGMAPDGAERKPDRS
ncbi:NUDIX hydrolase [Streptomyces noursei ATCC 11455]|uniref:NUDIX hydrolase n=1 Tax=Streptomyces noursei TaxID=1971 RepID=UPI00081C6239|nr:NUDIX hydrolase [Streptomyces noursei ATCC 11455]